LFLYHAGTWVTQIYFLIKHFNMLSVSLAFWNVFSCISGLLIFPTVKYEWANSLHSLLSKQNNWCGFTGTQLFPFLCG
jgi:hypothetical protein